MAGGIGAVFFQPAAFVGMEYPLAPMGETARAQRFQINADGKTVGKRKRRMAAAVAERGNGAGLLFEKTAHLPIGAAAARGMGGKQGAVGSGQILRPVTGGAVGAGQIEMQGILRLLQSVHFK